MSKLERKNHKVFGINATETKVGQFGSANATTKITTKDVEKIQALDAWEQGWEAGAVGNNRYPTQQERTGVDYEHSYQIGYMLQEGIPEWNKDTTYNKGSIIKLVSDTKIVLYNSLQDNNKNNVLTNTDYWEKLNLGGSGKELLEIYIDPFCDESENKGRIANGQIIVQNQFPEATKKLKKRVGWDSENKKATLNTSLVCTEEEWQAIKTASKLGQCGKFVIDDEAGIIRLPAIVNINGLTDLSKCGLIKDESLPAHKHTRGTMEITGSFAESKLEQYEASGAFYYDGGVGSNSQAAGGGGKRIRFSAARTWTGSTSAPDNATYQDNAPVQQEAVQYPYVICVNTGVEEAERPINNYQVNNTNSYGDNKYVGNTILNNLSWLRSVGQENPAGVHQDFFNWAIANIGQPFGAGLIKESTATDITEYDLVINQANQTFILPTLNGSEDLPSDKYDNLTLDASDQKHIAPANGWIVFNKISKTTLKYVNCYTDNGRVVEMMSNFDGQQVKYSFFVGKGENYYVSYNADGDTLLYRFVYAKGNGNLYYYVGDTLQNADLINIARLEEELVDRTTAVQAAHAAMPSNKYIDFTLGASGSTYTAPADGWIYIRSFPTDFGGYFSIVVNGRTSVLSRGSRDGYGAEWYVTNFVQITKGANFTVNYGAAKCAVFRFYYAFGSKE